MLIYEKNNPRAPKFQIAHVVINFHHLVAELVRPSSRILVTNVALREISRERDVIECHGPSLAK